MDCQSLSLWERWHCTSNDGEGEPSILSNFLHQFVDFFFGGKAKLNAVALPQAVPRRSAKE